MINISSFNHFDCDSKLKCYKLYPQDNGQSADSSRKSFSLCQTLPEAADPGVPKWLIIFTFPLILNLSLSLLYSLCLFFLDV